MRAKAELKALEDGPAEKTKWRVNRGAWSAGAPRDLIGFVDLEARLLKMGDHPLCYDGAHHRSRAP
jgi:hypothetical protein